MKDAMIIYGLEKENEYIIGQNSALQARIEELLDRLEGKDAAWAVDIKERDELKARVADLEARLETIRAQVEL